MWFRVLTLVAGTCFLVGCANMQLERMRKQALAEIDVEACKAGGGEVRAFAYSVCLPASRYSLTAANRAATALNAKDYAACEGGRAMFQRREYPGLVNANLTTTDAAAGSRSRTASRNRLSARIEQVAAIGNASPDISFQRTQTARLFGSLNFSR